ncbi:MAG TPA: hypothetical protein VM510_09400 [Caulifigura sp.]|nr:hypothetical protein [Caulifigura sp.]
MTIPINELDLQRCVDGELPLGQRRVLIEQLDQSTDGWKTLALAFLESQDFSAASAEFRNGPAASPGAMKSVDRPGRWKALPLVAECLALAASVAVAFWLGTRTGRPGEMELARSRASAGPSAEVAPNAERPRTYVPEDPGELVSLASNDSKGPQPTAVLKLPFAGTGEEELAIPVYDQRMLASDDGPEIPLVWPSSSPSASMSPPGYRVKSEKNLLSIPLSTGDTVYVPVEVSGVTYAVQ